MNSGPTVENRCYRSERCAERERVGNQWQGLSIVASRGLCRACTGHVSYALAELPADYVQLSQHLDEGGDGGPSELVGGTRELPMPINGRVEALQSAIDHDLQCWAEIIADRAFTTWDTQAARDCRPGLRIEQAADLLVERLSVLFAARDCLYLAWGSDGYTKRPVSRDGIDGALDLLALHQRARRAVGDLGMTHHLPAPCPDCQRTALQRRDGTEEIRCSACSTTMTLDAYEEMCGMLLAARA